MSDIIKAPEGIEIDLVMYLTSNEKGYNVRYALQGMPALTPFKDDTDVAALAKAAGLEKFANDWRLMTRAEVAEYKADNE